MPADWRVFNIDPTAETGETANLKELSTAWRMCNRYSPNGLWKLSGGTELFGSEPIDNVEREMRNDCKPFLIQHFKAVNQSQGQSIGDGCIHPAVCGTQVSLTAKFQGPKL